MYKAILINPKAKTVTEVTLDEKENLKSMYQHMECELITIAGYMPGGENGREDTVYADDEGLYKEEKYFSIIDGVTGPVPGNLLIVGTDTEGESISPQYTSLDEVVQNTRFLSTEEVLVFLNDNPDVGVLELE